MESCDHLGRSLMMHQNCICLVVRTIWRATSQIEQSVSNHFEALEYHDWTCLHRCKVGSHFSLFPLLIRRSALKSPGHKDFCAMVLAQAKDCLEDTLMNTSKLCLKWVKLGGHQAHRGSQRKLLDSLFPGLSSQSSLSAVQDF